MFKLCSRVLQSVSRMPYYAVRKGRTPGVYQTWDECKAQVNQFPQARYKKFDTEADAVQFINSTDKPGGWASKKASSAPEAPAPSAGGKKAGIPDSKLEYRQPLGQIDLEIADSKIEVLKEQLAIAKKEKSLIEKERKLQEKLAGKEKSKSFTGERPSPYSKKSSAPTSSATGSKGKSTKAIDLAEVRKLHTDTGSDSGSTIVYTDGCCFHNGAHGASAGIGVYWGPDHPMNTSERLPGRQTNNRAEIHAAIKAIKQAKSFGVKDLTIKTDSNFMIKAMTEWIHGLKEKGWVTTKKEPVIMIKQFLVYLYDRVDPRLEEEGLAMTEWIHGWKKKGWVTAKKEPVINKEDFIELDEVSQGIKVTYVHVPGHQGVDGNECADKLANAGARKQID